MIERSFTLVLSGGGMKGLAHVGVLKALVERGWIPEDVAGSSIGALVGACWCTGMPIREIEEIALAVTRRDLFRIAHRDMAFKRIRSPALYRREPLEHLIRGLIGDVTFDELERPLIVNTVDLESGTQVFWGAPGLSDVTVADAVFASCALPGYLPPQELRGRYYVDGAAVSNLPVGVARARGSERDLVLAVDVGSPGTFKAETYQAGFAAVYARAIEIAIATMRTNALKRWRRPPLVLVQPRVAHIPMFSFRHNRELIDEGYRATAGVLDSRDGLPAPSDSGVYPRRHFHVRVERDRCIGCRSCLVHGPVGLFQIDDAGKAVVTEPEQVWSPVDADFVRQCPTLAIMIRSIDGKPLPGVHPEPAD